MLILLQKFTWCNYHDRFLSSRVVAIKLLFCKQDDVGEFHLLTREPFLSAYLHIFCTP